MSHVPPNRAGCVFLSTAVCIGSNGAKSRMNSSEEERSTSNRQCGVFEYIYYIPITLAEIEMRQKRYEYYRDNLLSL